MRAVSCVALTLLLATSGKVEPSRATATSLPASIAAASSSNTTVPVNDAGQVRLIQISRFDCVTPDDSTDAADFPWSKGISHWLGGGPGGAVWNISELRCAVEFQTNCAQGEADAELRIGGAISGSERAKIARAGIQQITFRLMAEHWEKHVDQDSPLTKRFPYQTTTFSASVTASCQAPQVFGPSVGPRLEFADDHHFTAGFAKGE